MGTMMMAWLKANWFAAGVALIKGVDWAGVVARVFSCLLRKALRSGRYEAVRLLASRVIEQAQYVLAVTDDGIVSTEEAEKAVAAARRLFDAWADGKGKGVTQSIVAELHGAVGEVDK